MRGCKRTRPYIHTSICVCVFVSHWHPTRIYDYQYHCVHHPTTRRSRDKTVAKIRLGTHRIVPTPRTYTLEWAHHLLLIFIHITRTTIRATHHYSTCPYLGHISTPTQHTTSVRRVNKTPRHFIGEGGTSNNALPQLGSYGRGWEGP
jgi:hypothetical protein